MRKSIIQHIVQTKEEGKWRDHAIYNCPITAEEFEQDCGVHFYFIRVIRRKNKKLLEQINNLFYHQIILSCGPKRTVVSDGNGNKTIYNTDKLIDSIDHQVPINWL